MIKDKITPEIRERFKEEIKLTRERGKEHKRIDGMQIGHAAKINK